MKTSGVAWQLLASIPSSPVSSSSIPYLFLCSSFLSSFSSSNPATNWCFHWPPAPMTEGMQTRACALEEQLSAVNEQLARHDSILTKLDSFCTTVQQHSTMMSQHTETLDMVQKSLATQQSIMAEMMLKLQHLDKPTPPTPSHTPSPSHQPPLLSLPINTPVTPFHHSSPLIPASLHSASSTPTTQLPKIEVPVFTGEDILGWLFQINHFFAFHQIPDDQRVSIAAFYMAGTALQYFTSYIRPSSFPTGTVLFAKSSSDSVLIICESWGRSLQTQANLITNYLPPWVWMPLHQDHWLKPPKLAQLLLVRSPGWDPMRTLHSETKDSPRCYRHGQASGWQISGE